MIMRALALTVVMLLVGWLPLHTAAEEHVHGDKPPTADAQTASPHEHASGGDTMMDRCRTMMGMHQKMTAEMKSADAELDRLLAEMNGSTGDKKIEAMAAILNRLVQQRKTMHEKMAAMQSQMLEAMGKGASAKTAAHGDAAPLKGAEHKH